MSYIGLARFECQNKVYGFLALFKEIFLTPVNIDGESVNIFRKKLSSCFYSIRKFGNQTLYILVNRLNTSGAVLYNPL